MNYYPWKMWAPRSHCFSSHMSNQHLWQSKKLKSWRPFWSYQLNSTANSVHLPHKLGQTGWIGIWFFSIVMGAKPSSQLKSIAIWGLSFFMHNNSSIATKFRSEVLGLTLALPFCLTDMFFLAEFPNSCELPRQQEPGLTNFVINP